MLTPATSILVHLSAVEHERARREAAPRLGAKVAALKAYQQRRFSHTYADLLESARYGPASRFFLDELYGPTDFTRRDAQLERVVPTLVRLFPKEIVAAVGTLAQLHSISEALDTAMGEHLDECAIHSIDYVRAWQKTGRLADRQAQISLTIDVAGRLDRFTHRGLLRHSLRMMRGPARAAGLTELQRFLEAGFDTFRKMNGAEDFVTIVEEREQRLASSLFGAELKRADDVRTVKALDALP